MTASAAQPPRRRVWTLQTRLIVTVIGFVSALIIAIGLATGAILVTIVQQSLDPQLLQSVQNVSISSPDETAADILAEGREPVGFLLVLRTFNGRISGAHITGDESVEALSPEQIQGLVSGIGPETFSTVHIEGLGDYRVLPGQQTGGGFWVAGLPLSATSGTLARILTTVALVTIGGLLILAALLAVVIRRSLRPLRSVADTAERVAAMPLSEGAVRIAERVPAEQSDARTEVGRVGMALNTLLDHVDASLETRQRNEERMRQFVADASHELRTPLASIRGYSELSLRALRHADAPEDTTTAALERIQAQSLRMSALVEDLLLLARLEEGQELVYGTVDLSRLAVEAVGDAQVAGTGHTWRLDVGEEPVVIAGDEARLHQVVANLLANARTHTPSGTTVTVGVARDGADAVLRVEDDGPGIDPGIAAEIFERFSRADRSRARQTGGTGLGLSIARAIVDAHHGAISVESEPGRTVFTVRLPARPADPASASSLPRSAGSGDAAGSGGTGTTTS